MFLFIFVEEGGFSLNYNSTQAAFSHNYKSGRDVHLSPTPRPRDSRVRQTPQSVHKLNHQVGATMENRDVEVISLSVDGRGAHFCSSSDGTRHHLTRTVFPNVFVC